MNNAKTSEIIVWDPLIRCFHWILVATFCSAYLTEGEWFEALQDRLDSDWLQVIHVWSGYSIAALLVLRVIWGFIGPRYARFHDFVHSPQVALGYAKAVLMRRAPRYLGHNPAGGAMIVILLVSLMITVAAGLGYYGADKGLGPLAGALIGISDSATHTLKEIHEFFANFTLALVAIHLLGVIWESLLHRENLTKAMMTGRKRA
jgi:cytochrome b